MQQMQVNIYEILKHIQFEDTPCECVCMGLGPESQI